MNSDFHGPTRLATSLSPSAHTGVSAAAATGATGRGPRTARGGRSPNQRVPTLQDSVPGSHGSQRHGGALLTYLNISLLSIVASQKL